MTLMTEFRSAVGSFADRALELALPARCAGCYLEGTPLCRDCRALLAIGFRADPTWLGQPSVELPAPLFQLEWCGLFSGIAHRALSRLADTGDGRLSGPLGEAIANHWASTGAAGDVLVPVPSLTSRIEERGHDQAALLARVAGRQLRLPVAQVLARQHEGGSAAGEAFVVIAPEQIAGRAVVLVDGVVTTGATLAACATVLLAAGARVVSAVTVARTRSATVAPMAALALA